MNKEKINFDRWIFEKEQEIKGGQGKKVLTDLNQLLSCYNISQIPRQNVVQLAALARRVGALVMAISFLHRIIRPENNLELKANDAELVEYIGSLVQIGANREAQQFLKEVPAHLHPQLYLYEAFSYFSIWDYKAALEPLRKYIAHAELNDYQKKIGKINYLAALVIERENQKASELIDQLKNQIEDSDSLLKGNFWEIAAQEAISRHDFKSARKKLELSYMFLKNSSGTNLLFVQKWKAILNLFEKSKRKLSDTFEIEEVKKLANKYGHYETLRECDFYIALALENSHLLNQVYYGTRFPAYRRRICTESKMTFEQKHFDLLLNPNSSDKSHLILLDLTQDNGLKSGQVIDRLLKILSRDYYRPIYWTALHSELFPDNYLSPHSSKLIIHQAIKRTREWLNKNSSSVIIVEQNGHYHLSAKISGHIRIEIDDKNWHEKQIDLLRMKKIEKSFVSTSAAEIWGIEKHSAIRRLNQLIEKGHLQKKGQGRGARYVLST